MNSNALVLMTALVPTTGHRDLIDFAKNLPRVTVTVVVHGRSFEPTDGAIRSRALRDNFGERVFYTENDLAPQYPGNEPEKFWDWWREECEGYLPMNAYKWDYVVASEPYGADLATALGARFIPYDLDRSINPARGSDVRLDLEHNWNMVLPKYKKELALKAVFFGQESVGKTTISQRVADVLDGVWRPEYARPYLEFLGPEITESRMEEIFMGQASTQRIAQINPSSPYICFDTDLYSTIGYYEIWGRPTPPWMLELVGQESPNDVYYVLPDDVPFEDDILRRYGEPGVRESSTDFWKNLMLRYRGEAAPIVMVPPGSLESKVGFIAQDMKDRFADKTCNVREFLREVDPNK